MAVQMGHWALSMLASGVHEAFWAAHKTLWAISAKRHGFLGESEGNGFSSIGCFTARAGPENLSHDAVF